jgi:hypothetical protein
LIECVSRTTQRVGVALCDASTPMLHSQARPCRSMQTTLGAHGQNHPRQPSACLTEVKNHPRLQEDKRTRGQASTRSRPYSLALHTHACLAKGIGRRWHSRSNDGLLQRCSSSRRLQRMLVVESTLCRLPCCEYGHHDLG